MENKCAVIRQQMDETRTAMTDKIETLEHQVVGKVQAASAAVSETVQTVKDSVQETVATVKDTFDLPRQVDRRPWTMFAGATALGYLGGYLLSRTNGKQARISAVSQHMVPTLVSGHGAPDGREPASTVRVAEKPGWVSLLDDKFHAEIVQLQGLAVGTLLGLVRDIVTNAAPQPMERQVKEIVNGITVKLGGQVLEGRIVAAASK